LKAGEAYAKYASRELAGVDGVSVEPSAGFSRFDLGRSAGTRPNIAGSDVLSSDDASGDVAPFDVGF
jgi:hypothetical protein